MSRDVYLSSILTMFMRDCFHPKRLLQTISLYCSMEKARTLRNWLSGIVQHSNRSASDPVSVFSDTIKRDSFTSG